VVPRTHAADLDRLAVCSLFMALSVIAAMNRDEVVVSRADSATTLALLAGWRSLSRLKREEAVSGASSSSQVARLADGPAVDDLRISPES